MGAAFAMGEQRPRCFASMGRHAGLLHQRLHAADRAKTELTVSEQTRVAIDGDLRIPLPDGAAHGIFLPKAPQNVTVAASCKARINACPEKR